MIENNKTENKQITIYLEESRYAHSFKRNESIHSSNFNRVEKLIKKQIDSINNKEAQSDFSIEHQYNTITIFGGRGSGKTTFILSLLQDISETYKDKAQILGIIDPTQMEEKEHVFLVVLSLINKKVIQEIEKQHKENKGDTCCWERSWRRKLNILAKGLPTLKQVNQKQYENWDDNNYIVERGLENVTAAYDLEKNFHQIVDEALRILKKKFFVIAFDDIDVNMSKGWSVLETIRKYLTTPQIVVFLSGNQTLYSYNIRLQQWEQLHRLKEYEPNENYTSQVNQLEGQYFLKVLKPENRIKLMSLLEYNQVYGTAYEIKKNDKEEGENIEEKYKTILESFGIYNNTTLQNFMEYLLGLSIRSQISILSNHKEDISSQIDAYVSRMMAARIDIDTAIKNPAFTTISIVKYLATKELFHHSYLLIPNTEDHDVNGCVMGLTTIFVNQAKKHPWLLLDYLLKVGYTRHFNMFLDQKDFNKMLSYSGLMQDMSIKNNVILMIAVGKANNLNLPELISLKALAIKARKKQHEMRDLFDSVLKNEEVNTAQRTLALLPLFSLGSSQQQSTELYYSVLPLLSAVCHIARRGKDEENIKDILKDLSLHRTYPMPTTQQEFSNITENDITVNQELSRVLNLDIVDENFNALAAKLKEWRESIVGNKENNTEITIPPYLLGRIMTRFIFALKNIRAEDNLARQTERTIIIFLNACIVEEAKEKIINNNLSNNNPTGDDKLFTDNLNKINDSLASLQLSHWLISCPLIYSFLQEDIVDKIGIKNIDKSFLLYNILNNVEIKEKGLKITIKTYEQDLDNILKNINKDDFKKGICDKPTKDARKWLLKQPFVNSIERGVTKKIIETFKKKHLDK